MKKTVKNLWLPILITIILTLFIMVLPINGETEIYDKVVRLHVLANSDSEEDQELKLKVRDAVLAQVTEWTTGCASKAEAESVISERTGEIRILAEQTLRDNGCELPVAVTIGQEEYPTREYEGVRLPAGTYCSLRVMIGQSSGQNWWCVLFPPLCTSSASPKEELVSAGFTPGQVRILTDSESPEYVLKFKLLEIIKSLFS